MQFRQRDNEYTRRKDGYLYKYIYICVCVSGESSEYNISHWGMGRGLRTNLQEQYASRLAARLTFVSLAVFFYLK